MTAEATRRLGHPVPARLDKAYVDRAWPDVRFNGNTDPVFWKTLATWDDVPEWRCVCYEDLRLCAEVYSDLIAHASRGRIVAVGVYVRRVRDEDCQSIYLRWDSDMETVWPDMSVRWRTETSPSRVRAEAMVAKPKSVPFTFRDTPCVCEPFADIERTWGHRMASPSAPAVTCRWDLHE